MDKGQNGEKKRLTVCSSVNIGIWRASRSRCDANVNGKKKSEEDAEQKVNEETNIYTPSGVSKWPSGHALVYFNFSITITTTNDSDSK
jgi:hypothetical protein